MLSHCFHKDEFKIIIIYCKVMKKVVTVSASVLSSVILLVSGDGDFPLQLVLLREKTIIFVSEAF